MIEVIVPGEIVSYKRPANTVWGGRMTPPKVRAYMSRLAGEAALAMARRKPFPLGTPLRVEVRAAFTPPESWPKHKRMDALAYKIAPTGRPDLDNIIKLIDALKGIVWADDTQVVRITAGKFYEQDPYLMFRVFTLQE